MNRPTSNRVSELSRRPHLGRWLSVSAAVFASIVGVKFGLIHVTFNAVSVTPVHVDRDRAAGLSKARESSDAPSDSGNSASQTEQVKSVPEPPHAAASNMDDPALRAVDSRSGGPLAEVAKRPGGVSKAFAHGDDDDSSCCRCDAAPNRRNGLDVGVSILSDSREPLADLQIDIAAVLNRRGCATNTALLTDRFIAKSLRWNSMIEGKDLPEDLALHVDYVVVGSVKSAWAPDRELQGVTNCALSGIIQLVHVSPPRVVAGYNLRVEGAGFDRDRARGAAVKRAVTAMVSAGFFDNVP